MARPLDEVDRDIGRLNEEIEETNQQEVAATTAKRVDDVRMCFDPLAGQRRVMAALREERNMAVGAGATTTGVGIGGAGAGPSGVGSGTAHTGHTVAAVGKLPTALDDPEIRQGLEDGLRDLVAALQSAELTPQTELLKVPPKLYKLIPQPLRTSIYVRPLYHKLLSRLDAADATSATIVTGNAGVGKSAFALLLIAHLAAKQHKVLYAFKHDLLDRMLIKLDFARAEGAPTEIEVRRDTKGQRALWATPPASKVVLIIDGHAPSAEHSGNVKTVVLSSSTEDDWRVFKKGSRTDMESGVNVLFLDVWHPLEMERARSLLYPSLTAAAAAKRYREFGGIPRMVLADREEEFEEVKMRFRADDLEQLQNVALLGFGSRASHQLLHIRADEDFRFQYLQLASPEVAAMVFTRLTAKYKRDVRAFLAGAAGQTSPGGWAGLLFEQHGHSCIRHGLATHMRMLEDSTSAAAAPPAKVQKLEEQSKPTAEELSKLSDWSELALATHHFAADVSKGAAAVEHACPSAHGLARSAAQHLQHQQRSAATATGSQLPPGEPPSQSGVSGHSDLAPRPVTSGQLVTLPRVAHIWDEPGTVLPSSGSFYLQPVSTNNPAWDAVLRCELAGLDGGSSGSASSSSSSSSQVLILQYTCSNQHGVLAGPIVQLLQRLQVSDTEQVKMVFVVPDDPHQLYERFEYQPWLGKNKQRLPRVPQALQLHGVQQWVLRLPLSIAYDVPDQ